MKRQETGATQEEIEDATRDEFDDICEENSRLREALARESNRRDDERRQLHREYELRTRALQASHDRLLGLLSGEIAREPMPPIIVHRECPKCGAKLTNPLG